MPAHRSRAQMPYDSTRANNREPHMLGSKAWSMLLCVVCLRCFHLRPH